jgi:hypothetical protein
MRKSLFLLSLLATPALAQSPEHTTQVPSQLTDPATVEKLGNAMQAVSKAFLDLRVGELQAAVEGREATRADKKLTIRDLARQGDPNFELKFRQQMAEAKPQVEQSMKALADAWPSMMQGLEQAQKSLERAVSNMPQPGYPKR